MSTVDKPDNECPGCGNLRTFVHSLIDWRYYCHKCKWGFGHVQDPRRMDRERYE